MLQNHVVMIKIMLRVQNHVVDISCCSQALKIIISEPFLAQVTMFFSAEVLSKILITVWIKFSRLLLGLSHGEMHSLQLRFRIAAEWKPNPWRMFTKLLLGMSGADFRWTLHQIRHSPETKDSFRRWQNLVRRQLGIPPSCYRAMLQQVANSCGCRQSWARITKRLLGFGNTRCETRRWAHVRRGLRQGLGSHQFQENNQK